MIFLKENYNCLIAISRIAIFFIIFICFSYCTEDTKKGKFRIKNGLESRLDFVMNGNFFPLYFLIVCVCDIF